MKLRNKKTGEITNLSKIYDKYSKFEELLEEWEDYEEQKIKLNENQRNALNAFIDANGIDRKGMIEIVNLEQFPYTTMHFGEKDDFTIDLKNTFVEEGIYFIDDLKLEKGNIRQDLLDFCQCIVDQWDVDVADIQSKALKLIDKWSLQ